MAIKQAQYKVTLQSGDDIYHFQTDNDMVKIVDKNKNILGTFKEFGFEGKTVTSGSFKDLKVSGIYKIQNVTGLPSGYSVGKISILSVKAVGDIGSPMLISYDLISQQGEIYHNTVMGNVATGWTSGGTELANTIKTITNQVGSVSSLKTTSKANLVNAVNELKGNIDTINRKVGSLGGDYGELKDHNHDERYVAKSGDTMSGHLNIVNNRYLQGLSTTGVSSKLIGIDSGNNIILGDSTLKLNIAGSDLRFNGKRIWHEDNGGAGSGLDADKLGGTSYLRYARTDKENSFEKSIITNGSLYSDDSLFFGKSYAGRRGGFTSDASGNISVSNNSNVTHRFLSSGMLQSTYGYELNAGARNVDLIFKLNTSEGGMGFYRNNNTKFLGIYNYEKDVRIGYFHHDTSELHLEKPLNISGRKLFLQGSTPTGSIPTGSIWIS